MSAVNDFFRFVAQHAAWLGRAHFLKTVTMTPPERFRAQIYFDEPGWSMYESRGFFATWDEALDDAVAAAMDDLTYLMRYTVPDDTPDHVPDFLTCT